jgi:hypothetical protein
MGQVYDLILGSGAIEELSQRAGHDVRAAIERDLLFEAAKHTLDTPMSPTNYDGSRMMGLGLAGRLLDEPGFVAAAYDVYRNLIDNCFFSDHYWCEDAVNYFFMIVGDLLPVPEILSGSGGVDVHRELPFLPQVYTAPLGLFFPNGRSMPINDSWAWNTRGRSNDIGSMGEFVEVADDAAGNNRLPAVDSTFALFRRSSDAQRAVRAGELKALIPQNTLLPAAGEAVLGIGKGDDAVRVTFSFGPWGGHHHHDTLALSHYALGEELLSDIGYTWTTYRPWSTSAASHNTVLVDGQEQSEAGGNLLAFRPASALQAGFVSAEAPRAFPNTTTYRRSIVLLPTREDGGYIVDLFEVAGGSTHDYLLHGSADWDQHLTVSPDPRWAADAVTRGKAASRSARSEYVRNVRSAPATDGLRAAFTGKGVSVDVWFLETNGMRVVVGEGPSVRRAHEDDGQLPNSWRPLLCLRQSGGTSRFVTLIEAHRADGAVQSVKCVASQGTGIVLQVRERQCVRFLGIDPAGIGVSTRLPDGRVFELDGRLGIATEAEGKTTLDMCDAARLHVGDAVLENTRSYQGRVLGLAGDVTGQPERSELVTDTRLPDGETLAGKVIYVSHSSGAQSAYRIDRVEADREGSRVFLAGKPRFVLGRGQVKSGGPGKVESNVELPAAGAYAGQRIRVGQRVFTIRNTTGRASVGTEESFDFASLAGERFTVFSVAPGDRFRIAV